MSTSPRQKIMDSLHRARMRPYLDASQQNEKRALALYRWHGDLTSAVQSVLGVTEVIVRNAMDKELQAWNNTKTNSTHSWLLVDPAAPLRSLSAGKRAEANRRAQKENDARVPTHPRFGVSVSHDDVLAQIMFGLWKDLLPNHVENAGNNTENSNRVDLWNDALSKAFPNIDDSDGSVTFWRVTRLHQLRNRVSHMEPLLGINVKDRLDDAFELVRSIDADVSSWVTGGSKVSAVLRARPE